MTISVFLLAFVLLGGPPEADTAASSPNAEARFREGLKAYDAHDYPRALTAFEAAYRLTPLPEILFDIAMTHRSAGDCARAAKSFDAFIATAAATDPLLPRAQARRRELGSCSPQATGAPTIPEPAAAAPVTPLGFSPPAVPPEPAPATPTSSRPARSEPPRPSPPPSAPSPAVTLVAQPRRTWPHTTCAASIGGGVALGVAGAVFGVLARSAAREAEMAPDWNPEAQRADERARIFGQASTVLLVSAGVASVLALGTCSYGSWWGRNNGPPAP
jgi:hypothetical protein